MQEKHVGSKKQKTPAQGRGITKEGLSQLDVGHSLVSHWGRESHSKRDLLEVEGCANRGSTCRSLRRISVEVWTEKEELTLLLIPGGGGTGKGKFNPI